MTERDKLVARLLNDTRQLLWDDRQRAADALSGLQAENQRLREALKVIAEYREQAHAYDDDAGHTRRVFNSGTVILIEAIARAALRSTREDE